MFTAVPVAENRNKKVKKKSSSNVNILFTKTRVKNRNHVPIKSDEKIFMSINLRLFSIVLIS